MVGATGMSVKEIPFPLKVKMDTTTIPIMIALMPKTIFCLEPNFLDFFDTLLDSTNFVSSGLYSSSVSYCSIT